VSASGRQRVLIIAANARSLIANRGDLIAEMRERGHSVSAAVPVEDYLEEVERLGIEIHTFALHRTGLSPLRDMATVLRLRALIRSVRPDAVFAYGAKPVIYGMIAARSSRARRRYAMITGFGTVFIRPNKGRHRLVRAATIRLYRMAMRASNKVFFQNPDDIRDFIDMGILSDERKVVRTMGSGVNLQRFPRAPLPEGPPVFLFIGRLLTEKGLREFCAAARRVRAEWPAARFVAVGPHDPALPHSVALDEVERWRAEGIVEFVGAVDDVRPHLAAATVFVLPSYREGTPRSSLEALAIGRPVVTTDVPGCRETVVDGENGFLVPARDAEALAEAMLRFSSDPGLAARMAEASYRKAQRFDVRSVNEVILEAMELT
jgi:glycosyltransferase involved in cell wall biosynthesis